MHFHSVRNKMMLSTFLLILVCALIVIAICNQQMETHFSSISRIPPPWPGSRGEKTAVRDWAWEGA